MSVSEKDLKCYKIRDSITRLWSAGGVEPKFNKTGKTWSKIGHVKAHLAQYLSHKDWQSRFAPDRREPVVGIPETWEVVEFVISKTECAIRRAREVLGK